MSSPPNHLQPLELKYWLQDAPGDQIAICDPFVGDPIVIPAFSPKPDVPTPYLFTNPDLRDGYTFWGDRGSDIEIGVLLTDPARRDGLGDTAALNKVVREYDMVGTAQTRSVYRSLKYRGLARYVGGPAVRYIEHDSPHPEYSDTLRKAIMKGSRLNFDFDPSLAPGDPASNVAWSVQRTRELVWAEAHQEDPGERAENSSFYLHAIDLSHCNVLQWMQVGLIGAKVIDTSDQQLNGELPASLLLVMPGEQRDMARKLSAIGANVIGAQFALPEFNGSDEYWDYDFYMRNLEDGFIPEPKQQDE